jgi:poly(3-hydroxybutyrate) depolymerase
MPVIAAPARAGISILVVALIGCGSESTTTLAGSPEASTPDQDASLDDADSQTTYPPDVAEPEQDGSAPPDVVVGPVGCVSDISAGHHQFGCDGIEYDLEIPSECAAGGCGMVLDVHGLTMCADQQDKNTELRALGIQHGYVIVQPTAPSGPLGPSWTPVEDDEKIWVVLQQLRDALAIDRKRLHFTGFSQGGAMTWRFACKHADAFASVAPIAGANAKELSAVLPPFQLDCPFTLYDSPTVELAILHMHGTLDALVPFAKAEHQRDAAILAWNLTEVETVSSDAHHVWKRYRSPKGTVYEFLQHDYTATLGSLPVVIAGHCFPGGPDWNTNPSPGETLFFGCAPPNAFHWGQVVMKFFLDHPKP